MPIPPHPTELAEDDAITMAELALATRNHGMPLEAMRWDDTPVGMHYLLVHYDVPALDASAWRLELGGAVDTPLSLSLDALRDRPASTVRTTMECAGNGRALLQPRALSQPWLLEAVGTAAWTGVPLADVLDEVGVLEEAVELVFTGADRGMEAGVVQSYERSITVDQACASGALLAYEMNGQPLPPQHGFPVRLLMPGWYGMTNVKWLTAITAVTEAFTGYQNATAYRLRESRDEPGTPVTRIVPRSLLIPPGIPDFFSRQRLLPLGPCGLEGRAWSGWGPIEHVEISVDDGETWSAATLGTAPLDVHAWRGFTMEWSPDTPGDYVVCSRCRDAAGNHQPDEPEFNIGGYANNAVQRIAVTVTDEHN